MHIPRYWLFLATLFTLAVNVLASERLSSLYEFDKYGGWTGIQGTKTGFFHVEKIGDRHWFITPEGNVFFAVALSHLYSGTNVVACENVYGGDKDAWIAGSFEKARAMGFNCALGSATSPERNLNGFVDVRKTEDFFRENNFPFAVGVILLKHPWEFVEGEDLPDIFEPSYAEMIEERAAEICPQVKDDPLVMGYYYGFGAFNKSDIWVNQYLSLAPGSAGRNAIVDVLIERYDDDATQFNKVYGTSVKSISDLKKEAVLTYERAFEKRNYERVRKTLDPVKIEDFDAILDHMAITLYKIGYDAIRRWDTNHLIFGSFVKEFAISPNTWKAAAPYVDMIAPQHINKEIDAHALAAAAGLPILISDEYFGWHYDCDRCGKHAGLATHDARGDVYQANLLRHYKDPLVLGVSYCANLYDQANNPRQPYTQDGLYDIFGNPREKLVRDITKINHEIYVHASYPASLEELVALDKKLYDLWAENLVGHTLWKHEPKKKE